MSRAASRSAVFAPRPPAGLIGCTASPSAVTRPGPGARTYGTARTSIGKQASGSPAATRAATPGCQPATARSASACSAGPVRHGPGALSRSTVAHIR